jgi:hypothetical protein
LSASTGATWALFSGVADGVSFSLAKPVPAVFDVVAVVVFFVLGI